MTFSHSFHAATRPLTLIAPLTLAILCGQTVPASAQQPKAGSDWHRVEALPAGVKIDVKARTQHLHCALIAVTEDELKCSRGGKEAPAILQRVEIRSIKIGHRGRSAAIGAAIGGGGLGIAAFASTTSRNGGFFGDNFLRGPATAVGLVGGGVIGGGIGALTDFSKSTIYTAP